MVNDLATCNDLRVKYEDGIKWQLQFAMPGDIGLDLAVHIKGSKVIPEDFAHFVKPNGDETDPVPWLEIPPGGYAELEVGVRIKLPDKSWALITGRSSTAWKRRLIVIPGVIDELFVGPLRNLVYNPGHINKRIHEGDKLAQLIIIPKYDLGAILTVTELPDTARGSKGFGSSTPNQVI